uniref:E3 ubiquitin-protein ligase n=1 Tax=Culicoides sonorensis TaxID=179676 RepID=A0A336LVY8_CULSO
MFNQFKNMNWAENCQINKNKKLIKVQINSFFMSYKLKQMEIEKNDECSICLQTFNQPAKLPCGHVFCFLCIKGISERSPRCALCRKDISLEFLRNPKMIETPMFDVISDDQGFVWYYEGKNGWWQYDYRTTVDLEEAFMKKEKKIKILIAGNLYCIDFTSLQQHRLNDNTKSRRVKRDIKERPKKGIGGIRQKSSLYSKGDSFFLDITNLNLSESNAL